MLVFYYDRSFEGLLTVVFDAYDRREFPERLVAEGCPEPMFTQRVHRVVTDGERARRVWSGLCRKVEGYVSRMLACLWLSEEEGADELLMRYLFKVFDSPRGVAFNFADDDMLQAKKIAQRVSQEGHRLIQFVRFRKAADGTYFAPVAPRHNSLPLAVNHFRERFSDQRWIIYDMKRGYGYSYDLERVQEITLELREDMQDGKLPAALSDGSEELYSRLWKEYYEALAIKERSNPALRRRNMPARYWKYMTEFE